jgi:hypothetical protein
LISTESPVDFEQLYRDAALRPQRLTYTILKVAEMAESPHLSGMSFETKRASILMALEVAGADVNALLDDSVSRQRALNDYEEGLIKKQKEFEALKAVEAARLQDDLERTRAEGLARIRVHLDEVAREQEVFRAWQKRREAESARITGAAMVCVPEGAAKGRDSLAALLERSAFPPG